MKTLHFRQKSGTDGSLCLEVPVGVANAECEVVIVVEPRTAPADWLPGFWESLSQGWQGEPLERPAQGVCDVDSLTGPGC
jgi:hypothetical protein